MLLAMLSRTTAQIERRHRAQVASGMSRGPRTMQRAILAALDDGPASWGVGPRLPRTVPHREDDGYRVLRGSCALASSISRRVR